MNETKKHISFVDKMVAISVSAVLPMGIIAKLLVVKTKTRVARFSVQEKQIQSQVFAP
jgi:hypothetical protein